MPNENDIQNVVETPDLTPAEMFLRDLEGEVGSQSVEEPVEESVVETVPMENTEPIVEEQMQEAPIQEVPAMATMDDLETAKNDVISQIIEIAKQSQSTPEKVVDEIEDVIEPEEEKEEEFDEAKFLDDFYANPAPAIKSLADAIANKKVQSELSGIRKELEPLLAQSKEAERKAMIRGILGDFISQNADAEDYFDDIAAYVKNNNLPIDDMNTYKDAYANSKIARQSAELENLRSKQVKSFDDYLGEEESINKILNNEGIKEKIIANYLNELQKGGKPATISSGGSAATAGNPAVKPDSFSEAGSFLLRDLQ